MKLSINWLKDYVDLKLSTEDLVQRLTMAGLEVEEVQVVNGDTVLDLEITPNRPDCLNVIGLAREISAITAKNLKLPKIKTYKKMGQSLAISVEDKKDCALYIGTLITEASIASCGQEILQRINALGIKSINNAVDVTNFVLMEMGQPLHVFDYDKIAGGKVIVRRAKAGETIVTLDGVQRKLDPSILVIADALKPIAIAGIMGGKDTEVTAATKNILLESAHFDLGLVRRASRALGLKSDASYRFERGVDLQGVVMASNRATDLLVQTTKGKVNARREIGKLKAVKLKPIAMTIQGIEDLLGTKVSQKQVKGLLMRLGLGVSMNAQGGLKIVPPSFRSDLKQGVDVIEEVARIIGYDRLDVSFPHIQVLNIVPNSRPRDVKRIITESLIAQGYSETINYSLISQKDLDQCDLSDMAAIVVHNALSQEHNLMRPSLLPSLLTTALTNFNHGQKDLRLFEIGKRYFKSGEKTTLAILATGRRQLDWKNNNKAAIDFYDVKGLVDQIFCRLGVKVDVVPATQAAMDAGMCAHLKCQEQNVGFVGKVDKKVLNQWDIKAGSNVFFAEIDVQFLFTLPKGQIKYQPTSIFPPVTRDVSLAVNNTVSYGAIKETCQRLGGGILKNITLIEEYTGDKVQAGHRGLVFSLVYQSPERTLREEEVHATHQTIVNALTKDLGAVQR